MAHYALLDENNIVTEVFPGRHEYEVVDGISDWEDYYGKIRGQKCVRTSYNAATNGFRKNYAGKGFRYDEQLDAFIAPQPFPSWTLDEDCKWIPPIPYPDESKVYFWNEEEQKWNLYNG
jgi:hypothetical protein